MGVSRRALIHRIAAAGGYPAAFTAMQALGLLAPAEAFAGGPPDLAAGGGGGGARVVILGAGIAGVTAAYELKRAGYAVTVLEARRRPGGRAWTLRHGDRVTTTDGETQMCAFEDRPHHYMNAGPARLPSHHQIALGYCRELGVELEVEINMSRSALLLNPGANGGRPVRLRQAANDTRGHVAELLAKAVNRGALDQEVTAADKERLMAFLTAYGDLSADRLYRGSTRSGFRIAPGAGGQAGEAEPPLGLDLLLDEDMWNGVLFEEVIDMQATMFQARGGMDAIPAAFVRALGPGVLRLGAGVRTVRQGPGGVSVVYRDEAAGADRTIDAQFCLCTLPPSVLRGSDIGLGQSHRAAIAAAPYSDAIKIGWEAPRFWEGPRDQIYGGLSFVKGPTALVWYPSHGIHSAAGVLLGAYASGSNAARLGSMSRPRQIALSREAVERLHPGAGALLRHPLQVQWSQVEHSAGAWALWGSYDDPAYRRLNTPDGRVYFAGDHLSQVGPWMEGAMRSAHYAIAALDAAHRQGRPVTAQRAL